MINIWEVKETNNMVEQENLDVRTITIGISLLDCIDSDLQKLNDNIYNKITTVAKDLAAVGRKDRAGIWNSDRKQTYLGYTDRTGRRCGMQEAGGFCNDREYAGPCGKDSRCQFDRRLFRTGVQGNDNGR